MPLNDDDRRELELFRWQKSTGRLVDIDFPVFPEVRFGYEKPVHGPIGRKIAAGEKRYGDFLRQIQVFREPLSRVPLHSHTPGNAHWVNDWIPAMDGISIYSMLALNNPKTYLEIGSGISTTFARQAIVDHGLQTKIVSIDPAPRAEIDQICDEVVRMPLEKSDLNVFSDLTPGDVVFCDNSHRCFQNSDVTAFFLDILPALASGVRVGIHDIFLPHDYPAAWLGRFYTEQYLLGCYLLAGDALRIDLPVFHCLSTPDLRALADPMLSEIVAKGASPAGGAFWVTVDRQVAK